MPLVTPCGGFLNGALHCQVSRVDDSLSILSEPIGNSPSFPLNLFQMEEMSRDLAARRSPDWDDLNLDEFLG